MPYTTTDDGYDTWSANSVSIAPDPSGHHSLCAGPVDEWGEDIAIGRSGSSLRYSGAEVFTHEVDQDVGMKPHLDRSIIATVMTTPSGRGKA